MTDYSLADFGERFYPDDETRMDDVRTPFERDKARIIHSAGFRRLQGKTQVMGVGEGDFHRTRLTHSLEVAQIGVGILKTLKVRHRLNAEIGTWLPDQASVEAICYAHDLGHPPYGHGGERALHACMLGKGGFEGNAQTLRILCKLEKHSLHRGINPTRRTILGVLKYPVPYGSYQESAHREKPPKCYYDLEDRTVQWALQPFPSGDQASVRLLGADGKPRHRCLDASLMECADDIAYAVHDLEDIVSRRLVEADDVRARLKDLFPDGRPIGPSGKEIDPERFVHDLFKSSEVRKRLIGRLVNLCITEAKIQRESGFSHPLLRLRVGFDPDLSAFVSALKTITLDLVQQAPTQQLERRGRRVVRKLYAELLDDPRGLIPRGSWTALDPTDTKERRVCDYLAGTTDPFAERLYHRLFTPGFGSSTDEL